ncbi:MAG: chemotaxis protein CheA [Clostridiales bacterium]|jgi:two-component system chemotaxis sensor kinase CheA|nr:chemotaxis protein CheA [Clostridiales bacterium]
MADFDRDSMSEMFTFEMGQLIEQLEQIIIQGEAGYSTQQINEIFRIMHTIKGSAAMMMYDSISTAAHSMEDLFFYLREENPHGVDYSGLTDLILAGMDFIKEELAKVASGSSPDGDGSAIIAPIKRYLTELKGEASNDVETVSSEEAADVPKVPAPSTAIADEDEAQQSPVLIEASAGERTYKAIVFFEEGAEMENVRAFNILHILKGKIEVVTHYPEDLMVEESADEIRKQGFTVTFNSSLPYKEIQIAMSETIYLKSLLLEDITAANDDIYVDGDVNEINNYTVIIRFLPDCEMENIRAFGLVQRLVPHAASITTTPENLIDENTIYAIRAQGVTISITTTQTQEFIRDIVEHTAYVQDMEFVDGTSRAPQRGQKQEQKSEPAKPETAAKTDEVKKSQPSKNAVPAVISVPVSRLDQLLNLMGELVISEAMVTQNPELENLELDSFLKETRQLRKIIKDIQEVVMSMRMVPLSTTFFKMHRIVRDMCRQLGKDVQLDVIGEETEVDKNIIEHISDPLMHIIRNSLDHGIEMPETRAKLGKPEKGAVTLEAKNSGGDVLIIIRDDGVGLDKDKILRKAKQNGLLKKPELEYTDKEIQQFIFLPGFSTNEQVTSYSGRGVGMDVVSTNIEAVGGSVLVESTPGLGSVFTLKIPLTLAIIDGMTVKLGVAKFTIPIVSIKQSFKATKSEIFTDPDGNEMINARGEIYNVVRLDEFFGVESNVKNIEDGILIMLENGDQTVTLLADDLVGEQQVVVKSIPKFFKKIRGISGCTLLGNGEISLIIDVAGFFDK